MSSNHSSFLLREIKISKQALDAWVQLCDHSDNWGDLNLSDRFVLYGCCRMCSNHAPKRVELVALSRASGGVHRNSLRSSLLKLQELGLIRYEKNGAKARAIRLWVKIGAMHSAISDQGVLSKRTGLVQSCPTKSQEPHTTDTLAHRKTSHAQQVCTFDEISTSRSNDLESGAASVPTSHKPEPDSLLEKRTSSLRRLLYSSPRGIGREKLDDLISLVRRQGAHAETTAISFLNQLPADQQLVRLTERERRIEFAKLVDLGDESRCMELLLGSEGFN